MQAGREGPVPRVPPSRVEQALCRLGQGLPSALGITLYNAVCLRLVLSHTGRLPGSRAKRITGGNRPTWSGSSEVVYYGLAPYSCIGYNSDCTAGTILYRVLMALFYMALPGLDASIMVYSMLYGAILCLICVLFRVPYRAMVIKVLKLGHYRVLLELLYTGLSLSGQM